MAESKVSLVYKEQRGRCFIANQDVSQGDIVLVSKPYANIPSVTKTHDVCANCMYIWKERSHTQKMIACRQDCHHVFYCSQQCEQKHWDRFHQYECSFLNKVGALQNHGYHEYVINYARLVMRMLTQRFHDFTGKPSHSSLEDVFMMLSHFNEFPTEKQTEFGNVAKTLTEYILMQLIPRLANDNHQFIRCVQTFLPDSVDAKNVDISDADRWLTEMVLSYSSADDAAALQIYKDLLHKVYILICIEEVNGFFHSTFTFDGYAQSPQMYALGVYPSAVFFNHSCSPNIDRFLIEEDTTTCQTGDLVFFAAHSVKKDEELCISYGGQKYDLYTQDQVINANDIIKDQAIRKQQLKDIYFFDCGCTRCINECKGELDQPFMTLVKQLKCTKPTCKCWLIPSFEKHMRCEACGMTR